MSIDYALSQPIDTTLGPRPTASLRAGGKIPAPLVSLGHMLFEGLCYGVLAVGGLAAMLHMS